MKNPTLFFSVACVLLIIGACNKNTNVLTNYVQVAQNGVTTYYTVDRAYWQEIDSGAFSGKYYYITAFQAFTDSLNSISIEIRDNTTASNSFCPASTTYSDYNAPSSGCQDSTKSCTGFSVGLFSAEFGQYNATADSTSPPAQLTLFSCSKGYQQLSGTFQCRVALGAKTIALTSGQFNDVIFTKQ